MASRASLLLRYYTLHYTAAQARLPCISLGLVPHFTAGAELQSCTGEYWRTKEESLHHLPCGSLDSRPSSISFLLLSSPPSITKWLINSFFSLSLLLFKDQFFSNSKFFKAIIRNDDASNIDGGSTFLVVLMSRKTSPDFTLFSVFYCSLTTALLLLLLPSCSGCVSGSGQEVSLRIGSNGHFYPHSRAALLFCNPNFLSGAAALLTI